MCPGADCVWGGVCERVDLHLWVSEDAGQGGVDCVVDSEELDVLDPFFLISGGMSMVKRQLLKMGSLWIVWVSTFVTCLMLSSEKETRHWRR